MFRIFSAMVAAVALPLVAVPAAGATPSAADGPVAVIGAPRGSEDLRVQLLGGTRPAARGRLALMLVITNPSDVPMRDVRVRLKLPAGVKPLALGGARRRGRLLVWNVRHIAPGRSRIRVVRAAVSPRLRTRRCAVLRAHGPTVATARRCFRPPAASAQSRQ